MTSETDVLVIGAGLSGLAVAYELRQRDIAVRVLEANDRVAEPWRRRHLRLRLNTHRRLSSLPGLPLPRSAGAFPARDVVVAYLADYASRLDAPIEFNAQVRRIDREGPGWRVETSAGVRRARHVVFATGHDRQPHIPPWHGREGFQGELVHAAAFGDPARYDGRSVLVVGAGNSGGDVLNHLARTEPGRVWVSVRNGPVVFPARFLGVPVQLLSPVLELLPAPVVDRLLRLTQVLAFGRLSRFGLRSHPAGGATRLLAEGVAPAIDDGFVAALKAGQISVVPEVAGFEADRVLLADGTVLRPDSVICATGYRTGLEPIVGHLEVLDGRGAPRFHGGTGDARHPGLWFTGMRRQLSGFFRAAGRSAREIARAIEAELASTRDLIYPAPTPDCSDNELMTARNPWTGAHAGAPRGGTG